ncbi:hypothetical protein COV23_01690 [Candidatus Wolfebacteria bacterium CG10_big_fil_rev_8_21_14_0_10_31_9]|uniref:Phosphoribosyltransferase domain-containing protein n=1 Tax=Candidatus Wolfebacteria bacterium CG10_big_fil_rev_8_21_14_0_10_31_9 TaxID=1975070 RepID=A0A2H0RDL1_9BACT|nr:MAG: hypothetical protein COV23_01690 [Candidatus Wolfebacteria bacterium CG10_big_fil_rev_8_21_14_0_10_31_9]
MKLLRKKEQKKDHGIAQNINGIFKKGQRVLIIDDVVSSHAFTKIKAINVLKKCGLKVIPKIIVVVDREEGGKEKLKKSKYDLVSLFRFGDILKLYFLKKLITKMEHENSLKYSKIAKAFSLR